MKHNILALLIAATAIITPKAFAADSYVQYGPWIHNIGENSCEILWVSEKPTLGFVEVKENDGATWYSEEKPRFWQTEYGRRYVGRYHCVKVSGLKPGTPYQYKISQQLLEDADHPNAWNFGKMKASKNPYDFKTLDSKADSCKFSMVNDIHYDKAKFKGLTKNVGEIDFMVLNGDITSNARNLDTLLDYTFSPISKITSKYPVIYARGNHEGRGEDWFRVPYAFPTPTGEFYYTFRQGPAAFVVLDAGEDKPDSDVEYAGTAAYDEYREKELEWLKDAVKNPEFKSAPVKICIIHIPTLVGNQCWYTQRWISDNFMPVLEKAGIDLMLSGHHHKFAWYPENSFGNDYPIYVNSKDERLDVTVVKGGIELRSYDEGGNETHNYSIRKK